MYWKILEDKKKHIIVCLEFYILFYVSPLKLRANAQEICFVSTGINSDTVSFSFHLGRIFISFVLKNIKETRDFMSLGLWR